MLGGEYMVNKKRSLQVILLTLSVMLFNIVWIGLVSGGTNASAMNSSSTKNASSDVSVQSDLTTQAGQDEEAARLRSMRKVFAYMPSWGIFAGHELFDVNTINYDQITHVTYSFLKPVLVDTDNPTIEVDDPWAAFAERGPGEINTGTNAGIVQKLRAATKSKKDKFFVFSVGGWTYSKEGEFVKAFERATSTPAKIDNFATNIIAFMKQWDFDGVDIDWEFPEDQQAASQYLQLHKVLREKLTAQGIADNRYYQLSTATTPDKDLVQYIQPAQIAQYVDTVNFMAYDFYGAAFSPKTLHNAPLYDSVVGRGEKGAIDEVVKEYLKLGVPNNQLMMGVPFYSRSWLGVEPGNNPSYPGLGQPGDLSLIGEPEYDDNGVHHPENTGGLWGNGSNPYYRMEDLLAGIVPNKAKDYKRYWDDGAKVPYLYSPTDKVYHSYDDAESIGIKVQYIKDNGLAGSIIWDITGDTRTDKGTSGALTLGKVVGTLVGEDVDGGGGGGTTQGELAISTQSLSDAKVGIDYDRMANSIILAKGDGTLSYSLTNKPDWMSINSSTGKLSGTPTAPSTGVSITASVTNGTNSVSKTYIINVLGADENIDTGIKTTALPDAIVGQFYAFAIEANWYDLTFGIANNPAWLTIDSNTGFLTGTPSAAGNISIIINIRSQADGKTDSKTLTLVIKDDKKDNDPNNLPVILLGIGAIVIGVGIITFAVLFFLKKKNK